MTIQKFNGNNCDLEYLDSTETMFINGGGTDIAYDTGIMLRYTWYYATKNLTGQVLTIYQWCKQNGYK